MKTKKEISSRVDKAVFVSRMLTRAEQNVQRLTNKLIVATRGMTAEQMAEYMKRVG